ncbi:oxidoreductase [Paenibacillus koleovorans]|uniref:oxidoreductase n=1 Tax=Paenibacillus koleovorans TaxID=121608 RepID=UPI000FDBD25E|nr:oxidoreductase [Paenibacillus koleovorans]
MDGTFRALVVSRDAAGGLAVGVQQLRVREDLAENDLLVRVSYSSVNYKDALACSPNGNIVRRYPHIPGIDLAGTVVRSRDGRFREGDEVLVTGYDLGVGQYGGYSEYASIPADWAVRLPTGLTAKEAMTLGTAGFTAALSVLELQQSGVTPDRGPVVVTGATGGVGSLAVAMLAGLGYEVAASSGKAELAAYLRELGAARVLSREELVPEQPRPLDKQLWAGAVDCVGGKTLGAVLSSTRYGGAVAASGLTGGTEWTASVFPFILRSVRLIGIDSVQTPMETRLAVWEQLASAMKPVGLIERIATEIELEQVPDAVRLLLAGQSRGRLVVRL